MLLRLQQGRKALVQSLVLSLLQTASPSRTPSGKARMGRRDKSNGRRKRGGARGQGIESKIRANIMDRDPVTKC